MNTIQELKTTLEAKQVELLAAQKAVNDFELDESDYEESYKDFLDEEPIMVCGMAFNASRILAELDPIAYNCGLSDYVDGIDKEDTGEYKELEMVVENLENEIEWLDIEINALENEAE